MTQIAYGIALAASRGVLTPQPAPWWLPAGIALFADVPNGRFWAARRVWPDFSTWLAAAGGSFSGAAGRTYATAAGALASAGLNVPRINTVSGVSYFLYEPAATNTIKSSGAIGDADWTTVAGTSSANATAAPDGTISASLYVPNTTSVLHRVTQGTASGTYVYSAYVKPNGYTKVGLREDYLVGNYAAFLLSGAGAVLSKTAGAAAAIEPAGNGFYQIQWTNTGSGGGAGLYVLPSSYGSGNPANTNWSGDGVSGVYWWGAQVETGSAASSYVATASAAATRAAESVSGLTAPGNLTVTFDDASTQIISATNFATAANLNRRNIATIAA